MPFFPADRNKAILLLLLENNMCGATIAAVGVAATVGNMVYQDVSAPSGGSSGSSGGGSGGSPPMFNTTAGNVPNPNYSKPMGDSSIGADKNPLKASQGIQAKVTDANQVPAARDSKSTVGADYDQSWGNRLHNYIGYATRSLG